MNLTTSDVFAILAVVIALSAYLAVVRQRLLDTIKGLTTPVEKKRLTVYLRSLTIGDIFLILSIICFSLAWVLKIVNNDNDFFASRSEHWVKSGIILFLLGLSWLASLHILEWIKAFANSTCRDKISDNFIKSQILAFLTLVLLIICLLVVTVFLSVQK